MAVGQYTVTVSNSGFKTKLIESVVLQVGATRTLDVQLEIGLASEQVQVRAELSPADRSSAEQSAVIRDDQILDLPMAGIGPASHYLHPSHKMMVGATNAPFVLPGVPETITTFPLTAWTPVEFKSKRRSHRPAYKFPKMRLKSIAWIARCTMQNTVPRRAARLMS